MPARGIQFGLVGSTKIQPYYNEVVNQKHESLLSFVGFLPRSQYMQKGRLTCEQSDDAVPDTCSRTVQLTR